MWPRHSSPTRQDRTSVAPYNFVPLPEEIITVDSTSEHSNFSGRTGYITCHLTTLTPLYTRTAMTPDRFRDYGDDIRQLMQQRNLRQEYAQFFHTNDAKRPVIPGSSIRGMLRNLLEIAGFARMPWVTNKQLFFRTVDSTSIGKHYRERMVDRDHKKVEAGILRKDGGKYVIKVRDYAKVNRRKLPGSPPHNLYQSVGNMKVPKWNHTPFQYQRVWVTLEPGEHVVDQIRFQDPHDKHYRQGILVITGNMSGPRGKQHEFVMLEPHTDVPDIEVPESLLDLFQDDDQVTQWQQIAFPIDKPNQNERLRPGWLSTDRFLESEGDPIFFLRESGQLTFFGRAQMFRLPYEKKPYDFVPNQLKEIDETLDLVDALFGYVPEGKRKRGAAGRVFICDAECTSTTDDIWLEDATQPGKPLTPSILASPKPTSFQHYLVQDHQRYSNRNPQQTHDADQKTNLAHYGTPTPDETVIRGHKLYWHKQDANSVTAKTISDADPALDWTKATQYTQIRPVKAGVNFKFRIYFENLQDHELGALLWTLCLPITSSGKPCRHKLGMGKPLGLGSIEITAHLTLTNRLRRYTTLFEGDQWACADVQISDIASQQTSDSDAMSVDALIAFFERFILNRLPAAVGRPQPAKLIDIHRIGMLAKILEWPGPPDQFTRYSSWNELRDRPVLPEADHVGLEPSPDLRQNRAFPRQPAPPIPVPDVRGPQAQEAVDWVIEQVTKPGKQQSDAETQAKQQIPIDPKSADEIHEDTLVWATVVSATFASVILTIGQTDLQGTLTKTQMTQETQNDVPSNFMPGSRHKLWVKTFRKNKTPPVTLTMKNPGS